MGYPNLDCGAVWGLQGRGDTSHPGSVAVLGVLGGRWEACKEMALGKMGTHICTAASTHRRAPSFVPVWAASPKRSSMLLLVKWGAGSMPSLSRTGPSALRKGTDSTTVTPGDRDVFKSATFPVVHTTHLHKAATLKISKKQGVEYRRFSLELQVFSLTILVPLT